MHYMHFDDPEMEASGPAVHGHGVVLFPQTSSAQEIKSVYVESLKASACPYSENPSDFEDPEDIYQGPVPTYFLAFEDKGMLDNPEGGENVLPWISIRLKTPLLYLQPLGKGCIWTYALYLDGHLVARHASCPEWMPEGILGDCDFDDYERIHGREKALQDYMKTWNSEPELISDLFKVPRAEFEPYLRQFTLSELDEWGHGHGRKKHTETKIRPDDRYSIASPWVMVHFVEHLGFPNFRDIYWKPETGRKHWSAPVLYRPSQYKRSCFDFEIPKCAQEPFPFGGYFWDHDSICGET